MGSGKIFILFLIQFKISLPAIHLIVRQPLKFTAPIYFTYTKIYPTIYTIIVFSITRTQSLNLNENIFRDEKFNVVLNLIQCGDATSVRANKRSD